MPNVLVKGYVTCLTPGNRRCQVRAFLVIDKVHCNSLYMHQPRHDRRPRPKPKTKPLIHRAPLIHHSHVRIKAFACMIGWCDVRLNKNSNLAVLMIADVIGSQPRLGRRIICLIKSPSACVRLQTLDNALHE